MFKLNKKVLSFGLGMITYAVAGKFAKTDMAKKAAVKTVVGGMRAKDCIDQTIEKAREDFEDTIAEAKVEHLNEKAEKNIQQEKLEYSLGNQTIEGGN